MIEYAEAPRSAPTSVQEPVVRAALSRILESEEFARSKRMGLFLRFVVEETLAGRGARLKAFSIAREVYGRDETFDARSDAVVREWSRWNYRRPKQVRDGVPGCVTTGHAH